MATNIQPITAKEVESAVLDAPSPVAVDFYQATCPPCRILEPLLERIASEYAGRIKLYRVDIDRDMPVAQRFNVASIPTVLVMQAGQERERLDGLITHERLRQAFDRAVGSR